MSTIASLSVPPSNKSPDVLQPLDLIYSLILDFTNNIYGGPLGPLLVFFAINLHFFKTTYLYLIESKRSFFVIFLRFACMVKVRACSVKPMAVFSRCSINKSTALRATMLAPCCFINRRIGLQAKQRDSLSGGGLGLFAILIPLFKKYFF